MNGVKGPPESWRNFGDSRRVLFRSLTTERAHVEKCSVAEMPTVTASTARRPTAFPAARLSFVNLILVLIPPPVGEFARVFKVTGLALVSPHQAQMRELTRPRLEHVPPHLGTIEPGYGLSAARRAQKSAGKRVKWWRENLHVGIYSMSGDAHVKQQSRKTLYASDRLAARLRFRCERRHRINSQPHRRGRRRQLRARCRVGCGNCRPRCRCHVDGRW